MGVNQTVIVGKVIDLVNDNMLLIKANMNGGTEIIGVELSYKFLSVFRESCNIGDLVGIRGYLKGTKDGQCIVVADKLTFLSSEDKEMTYRNE